MLTIDRAWNATCPAHDVLQLGYRRRLPGGAVSEMQGEVWAFTIRGPGVGAALGIERDEVSSTCVWSVDLDGTFFLLAHGDSVGPALAGKVGLRWSLAEVLPGGQTDTRYEGQITITRSASAAGVSPPLAGEGNLCMIDEEED